MRPQCTSVMWTMRSPSWRGSMPSATTSCSTRCGSCARRRDGCSRGTGESMGSTPPACNATGFSHPPRCLRARATFARVLRAAVTCLAAAGWLAGAAAPASAQAERVLLVAPPPELEPAVRTALSPWPIQIRDTAAPKPGVGSPRASRGRRCPAPQSAPAPWPPPTAPARCVAQRRRRRRSRAVDLRRRQRPRDRPSAGAAAALRRADRRGGGAHGQDAPAAQLGGSGGGALRRRGGAAGAAPHLRVDTIAAAAHPAHRRRRVEPRLGVGVRVAPGRLAALGALAAAGARRARRLGRCAGLHGPVLRPAGQRGAPGPHPAAPRARAVAAAGRVDSLHRDRRRGDRPGAAGAGRAGQSRAGRRRRDRAGPATLAARVARCPAARTRCADRSTWSPASRS